MIYFWLNKHFEDIKKGEKLFIVDLETVSLFSNNALKNIAQDDEKYTKTPFLYLIASYNRNKSLLWAYQNFKFNKRVKKGSWMIYSFEKI